ncbi:adenylate/guanylate cyclase domain-containing protein [Leptospira sp. 96542]|nr:adenylate/guanylate cyclase domain-containing protein [Leptospira sp. 96542]
MSSPYTFEIEILKSELKRARALFWIFFIGAAILFLQVFFIQWSIGTIRKPPFPVWVPSAYFSLNALYAFTIYKKMEAAVKARKKVKLSLRYLGAFVESSIPTIILLYLGLHYHKPVLSFVTPPEFAYFFFIILATLRLDVKLALFIGVVSWLQYILLAMYFISITDNAGLDPLLTSKPMYFAKANLIFVGALISAYVSKINRETFLNTLQAEAERNQIRSLFGQHVSPEVVNTLLEQRDDWDGEEKEVCILFFDIRNFTKFSETQKPAELIRFLNAIFQETIHCVNEHHGIVNKFLGDGFMAVFGAPITKEDHILACTLAAKAIRKRIADLIATQVIPPIQIGMGIHAGEVITGNVGSNERKEYTVIGDVVNLASRLEQLTKEFAVDTILSESVAKELKADETIFLGDTKVKGKENLIPVYQLL